MKHGTLVLEGTEEVLEFFVAWLTTPGGGSLFAPQRDNEVAEAIKNLAQARSMEPEPLQKCIGIFRRMGFDDKAVRALFGARLEILLETYDDVATLERLEKRGVIVTARVYRSGTRKSSG